VGQIPQTGSSNRSFGIVFAVVFALLGLWPLMAGETVRWWALGPSVIFLGLALVRPAVLQPLNRLWTKFGLVLHRLVNPVIMAVLFFLTIVPLGLVMRVLGKDLLLLSPDPQAKSYWIERRPPGPDPETMPNQF
jgi:hypothetical protein